MGQYLQTIYSNINKQYSGSTPRCGRADAGSIPATGIFFFHVLSEIKGVLCGFRRVHLNTDDDNELQEIDGLEDGGAKTNVQDIENRSSVFRSTTEHFPSKDAYGAKVVTYLKLSKTRKSPIDMTRDLGVAKLIADKSVKNRDTEYARSLREARSVEDAISLCERIAGRERLLGFPTANSDIRHQKMHLDTPNVHKKTDGSFDSTGILSLLLHLQTFHLMMVYSLRVIERTKSGIVVAVLNNYIGANTFRSVRQLCFD
ncbi:hypothetical protein K501DRAFT_279991 [Backusella circina FSU 941]|nr:hypothetical protein K501DRAFT_279991 [Backusella circina FSU 941]